MSRHKDEFSSCQHPADLEGFCPTRPTPGEVTAALHTLGCELVFQMDACASPPSSDIPALPAQYHYSDRSGTEVIYLAGRDRDLDGGCLPTHASRFWLFPGADVVAYQRIASYLAVRWRLFWRRSGPPEVRREIA